MLAGSTFGCLDSEYCSSERGKVLGGLDEQIGTLLGPERTRECLSVIGLLPRMDHLAMFRPAPAVVRGILIVL
jgi:hypothetical protein